MLWVPIRSASHHKTCCGYPSEVPHSTKHVVGTHQKCLTVQNMLWVPIRSALQHENMWVPIRSASQHKTCCGYSSEVPHCTKHVGTIKSALQHKTCCGYPSEVPYSTKHVAGTHQKCLTAQNVVPHRGSSNEYLQFMFLSRNIKNNVYPCKPQFLLYNSGI